jgi:hypothetical protein
VGNLITKSSIRDRYNALSISKMSVSLRFALILVVVAVVSHWQWFVPGYQFRWSDSGGIPAAAFPQYGVSYVDWLSFTGLGGINIQPYQFMFLQSWHLLANLGVNFATTEQLTMLWPIALLSFLSPYLFIRRILKSDLGGFAGALVFGFSTTFLVFQGYEVFLALAFSLLPLVMFTLDVFLVRRSWTSLVVFVVSFSALCYVEIRVAFLALLMLLWYLPFAHFLGRRLPSIWKVLVGGGLYLLLNIFWIVEAFGVSHSSIVSTTSRSVFGNGFTNFEHTITLVSGSWVNGSIVPFTLGPIGLVMWALPILAIIGVSVRGSTPRWIVGVFAGTVAVAGVLLAKQANPPFSFLFPWVYNHVPGFSLYRVGSDFLILASLGYGILIGRFFATRSWSRIDFKRLTYRTLYPIALAAVIVSIAVPLIDGRVGSLFVHRSQPAGLSNVDAFIDDQHGFFRTLWLPTVPNWSDFSLTHPAVGGTDLIGSGQPLASSVSYGTSTASVTLKELSSAFGKEVLAQYSVHYLILPPPDSANLGPMYVYYGEPRKFYLKWLESQAWLKPVPGFGRGFSVFRVISPKPRGLISLAEKGTNARPFVVNSGLLVASLSEVPKSGTIVNASMLYNSNWRAYLVPLSELSGACRINKVNIESCAIGSGFHLLLDEGSGSWKSLTLAKGPTGQLQFRVPSDALMGLTKDADKVAVVMVFGSALETWSLFYVAEVALLLCGLFVVVGVVLRSRSRRTMATDDGAEPDGAAETAID